MARRDLPGIDREPEEVAEPRLRRYALEKVIEQIRASVARLGVRYDEWFWEDSIWQWGLGKRAIDRRPKSGHLRERDGALWFGEPDDEGEEEQRVVIRANGQPTYFASDLGYLLSRFEQRTFNRVIEVWAADHHGYVPRMKAAAAALGLDPEKLVIIIHQLVNLKEGAPRSGQKVKMSKRAGRFVTLDELIDRVGSDAVRYFYLLRSPDTTIEFDLELAVTQGNENPVYYAQYAHARLANVESAARQRHANLPASAVVTDPYPPAIGLKLSRMDAEVVTVSHDHENHSYTQVVRDGAYEIRGPGEYEVAGVSVIGVPTYHDEQRGARHGRNTVYLIEIDDVRVCPLGHLGLN